MKTCWVEIGYMVYNRTQPVPIRIFRNKSDAMLANGSVMEWVYKDAVKQIRLAVYNRARGECQRCGKRLTWKQAHMDERVSRGDGGEISVDNSWILCYDCHLGSPNSEHCERRWGGKHVEKT